MSREQFILQATDGLKLFCYKWSSQLDCKGVIILLHGMAEHALRYDHFANELSHNGYTVYACDLRGHGKTGKRQNKLGFFARYQGWAAVLKDILILTDNISKDNPTSPLFLFGHSMGSFLARNIIAQKGSPFQGVILSGTSIANPLLSCSGFLLAKGIELIKGSYYRSSLLDQLSFGSFRRHFRPNRTPFDWLSQNDEEVDIYVQDPLCGFICTASFFGDLTRGMLSINKPATISAFPTTLSLLLISGTKDPVSHMGNDIIKLQNMLESKGNDVECIFYQDCRHDLLHEVNYQIVYYDIINWLNNRV